MNKISSNHYIFLLLSVTTIALRSYSSIFIAKGGRDTWIFILLSYTIMLIITLLFLKRYITLGLPNFYSLLNAIKPKIISKLLLFTFCLGLFFNAIESATIETNSIHINFFINTPVWYCLIFFLLAGAYAMSRNINTMIITCIVTVTLVLVGDIIFLILIAKYIDLSNVLPILRNGFTKENITCIIELLGASSCIFITLPYIHLINKPTKLINKTLIAILITMFLITTAILCVLGFFNCENAKNIFYPEYILCQQIEIGDFLEFGELFYIFRSVCLWFLKYIFCSIGILFALKDIIKNKVIFIGIYTVIIFIISILLSSNQLYLFNILHYLQYSNIITFLIVPVTSVIIFRNNNI